MFRKLFILMSLVMVVASLSACTLKRVTPTPSANMPNPASVNCEEKGGRLDMRKDASGGEIGICVFPDGSECEEWAFFRGECQQGGAGGNTGMANPASVNCEEKGGTLEIRTDETGAQTGFCTFPNGTECEEWALFRGECTP